MIAGALVTCVAVFLVSGLYSTARSVVRYHQISPYKRYLLALRRIL